MAPSQTPTTELSSSSSSANGDATPSSSGSTNDVPSSPAGTDAAADAAAATPAPAPIDEPSSPSDDGVEEPPSEQMLAFLAQNADAESVPYGRTADQPITGDQHGRIDAHEGRIEDTLGEIVAHLPN
ncbi:hypothetical protein C8A05DRAFT_36641 [Staphylotrichum tortipilum]|uniref:Uncharacterized protein n=1 Tax=Staphylotrichum tortipilum TaxID=2831512 RepID=A0AAN6MF95_9PEZI|nr:hypothetical protein C8A05DRAFT_36641 [Staphylotrichum longicolle]